MRKEHRPYFIKKLSQKWNNFYTNHFIKPQFEHLGEYPVFNEPWFVDIFGKSISIGDHVHVLATSDNRVRISVWPLNEQGANINIGNYCLICPGSRIGAGTEITIKDSCMLASGAYITDSDWHDVYNRNIPGKTAPVVLEENVWIGDRSTVCKGVTIGENSVIGAGSIVINDIPANTIAAGCPAKVVKELDPDKTYKTRKDFFSNVSKLKKDVEIIDKLFLKDNTILKWIQHSFFPTIND